MARKTFTVTHLDGTRSTRTSQRAEYAYAAVHVETAAARAADADREARRYEEQAAVYADALAHPFVTRVPWGIGEGTLEVSVCGIFTGVDRPGQPFTDDDAVAVVERYLEGATRNAEHYRAVEAAVTGAPTRYSVLRWSRTQALAEKGAREFERLVHHGSTITVVPVD